MKHATGCELIGAWIQRFRRVNLWRLLAPAFGFAIEVEANLGPPVDTCRGRVVDGVGHNVVLKCWRESDVIPAAIESQVNAGPIHCVEPFGQLVKTSADKDHVMGGCI